MVIFVSDTFVHYTFRRILTQFGTMMHFEPLDRSDRQKLEILQIQHGGDFDEIWYDGAVQPSWASRPLKISNFNNPRCRQPPC